MSDVLDMNLIVEENQVVDNFPPLNNIELNERINKIAQTESKIDEIEKYFLELSGKVQLAIDSAHKKAREQVQHWEESRNKALKKYYDIAEFDSLKQWLADESGDQGKGLLQYLSKKISQADKNGNILEIEIDEVEKYQHAFSEKEAKEITQRILKEIQDIHFFSEDQLNSHHHHHHKQEVDLLRTVEVVPSRDYNNSEKRAKIERVFNNNIQVSQIKSKYNAIQLYLDYQLSYHKKYIIQLTEIKGKDSSILFEFGLANLDTVNSKCFSRDKIAYSETDKEPGIHSMVKGTKLHTGILDKFWASHKERSFEIRICLKEKIMKVALLPDYQMVAELDDKNKIDLTKKYTFCMLIGQVDSKYYLSTFKTVKHFNSMM